MAQRDEFISGLTYVNIWLVMNRSTRPPTAAVSSSSQLNTEQQHLPLQILMIFRHCKAANAFLSASTVCFISKGIFTLKGNQNFEYRIIFIVQGLSTREEISVRLLVESNSREN